MAWKDLKSEIEGLFSELSEREDEVTSTMEQRSAWAKVRAKEVLAWWRYKNPDKYRASYERRLEKLRTDPVYRAHVAEQARVWRQHKAATDQEWVARKRAQRAAWQRTPQGREQHNAAVRRKRARIQAAVKAAGMSSVHTKRNPHGAGRPRFAFTPAQERVLMTKSVEAASIALGVHPSTVSKYRKAIREREALRVAQGAHDADVVDCAGQVGGEPNAGESTR